MSLQITITVTQRPEGTGWHIEPSDQMKSTTDERIVGNLMLVAIDGIMIAAAHKLKCPIQLMRKDIKGTPPQ